MIFSTFMETYLKWIYPLKKHNMIPKHAFIKQVASCMLPTLPATFYKRVDEGSIVLKKSQSFHFTQTGIVLEEDMTPIPTDVVIFATGFRSDESFSKIFKSAYFQSCIFGSSAPFYRYSITIRLKICENVINLITLYFIVKMLLIIHHSLQRVHTSSHPTTSNTWVFRDSNELIHNRDKEQMVVPLDCWKH